MSEATHDVGKRVSATDFCLKCKICGGAVRHVFDLPAMKSSDGPMVPSDDDGTIANFYECRDCRFLFSDIKDEAKGFYEFHYSGVTYDREPGSEAQYVRLMYLAANLVGKPLHKCEILDFGCGTGHFVKTARHYLGLSAFGYDLARRDDPDPFIFSSPCDRQFDIVVAREVVEHFTEPRDAFLKMKRFLKPGGALAFQTCLYEPSVNDRSWGYIGPRNGHVSLYSADAFDRLAEIVGVARRVSWQGYPGIQAWQLGEAPAPVAPVPDLIAIKAADLRLSAIAMRQGAAITEARIDTAGPLIYGPYCELAPGRYRVVVVGRIDGPYRVRFCRGGGSVTLGRGVISGRVAAIDVEIEQPCHDFECIISRRPDSGRLWLEGLALHRIATRPAAGGSLGQRAVRAARGWTSHLWRLAQR